MPSLNTHIPVIGVIGASSADDTARGVAEAVGAAIAEEGWHLICGGGGGVMAAACKGHRRAATSTPKGVTIGVLPGDDGTLANPYVDVVLPTGIGLARNAIIARAATGVVAVGGCSGTLSEIALAWQFGRPIAAMTSAGGWAATLAGTCIDDRYTRPVFGAATAAEAIRFLAAEQHGRPPAGR